MINIIIIEMWKLYIMNFLINLIINANKRKKAVFHRKTKFNYLKIHIHLIKFP